MKKTILSSAIKHAIGVLVTASILPSLAAAQNTNDPDEIIITGFKKSLESTIEVKKAQTSIVEVVSAEDIGKLPDSSIAESISRLPGLTGQRVNGRTQVISIRGLSPDFSTTTLNGRQQASTGDNRAVEYDQYPSELINGVVVYKTADASLTSMGISGAVDLHTIRPLEYGKRAVVFNVRGEKNSYDQLNTEIANQGWRGSASYIDQFADNSVGVAVGYAHMDTPTQIKHYKAWEWNTVENALDDNLNSDDAKGLVGQEVEAISRKQVRDGVMGVLEFSPNENVKTIIDGYYSKFKQDEIMRGAMWFTNQWTGDGMQFLNPVFSEFGGTKVVQSATATNLRPVLRNDNNTREDKLSALGMNNEFKVDKWTLTSDFSYSHSERTEQVLETYAGVSAGFDTIKFDLRPEGYPTYTPGTDWTDVNKVQLSDPAPWGGWGHDGTIRYPEVKENIKAVQLSANYNLADSGLDRVFSSVDIGYNYTARDKNKVVNESNLNLKNGRTPVHVDPSLIVKTTSLDFAGIPGVISYNVLPTVNRYYDFAPILDANHWDKAWEVNEKIQTGYLKINVDTTFFGLPLKGNLGEQIINADQLSDGYLTSGYDANNPATLVHVSTGATYTDILPSLNLSAEVFEDQYIRFAAAKTIARPRMDELRANISAGVSVDSKRWSGSGGNPQLEPWRAKTIDLSYDIYFNKTSYVSLAGFYKKLDSYIYKANYNFDFSNAPNTSGIVPISNIGNLSLPVNGQGGLIQGLELSGSFDAGMISDLLSGLGIVGSESWTDSGIHPDGPGTTTKLPGLSNRVSDFTVYYEKGGFSARISQRFRSEFRGEVVQLFATRGFTEVLPDEQVDAQLSYAFDSGALEGTTILLQVNNLTDTRYGDRLNAKTSNGGYFPQVYEKYGRQILFGVSYKL